MSTATKATPAVARYAAAVRYGLSVRNEAYARTHKLKHQASYGSQPVVCYEPDGDCHGNFLPESYRAIFANPLWARRLRKAHTAPERCCRATTAAFGAGSIPPTVPTRC